MSVRSYKFCVLLYVCCIVVASFDLGCASPLAAQSAPVKDDAIKESLEETNEFNQNNMLRDSAPMGPHLDEDSTFSNQFNDVLGKMKTDVEILESNEPDLVKDKDELEELYRGPSIVINTDEFINENIEMNAEDAAEERADQEALANSHMILSIILVVVVLVSIGLYAGLVMWRSHTEQRYGMRELLVTNDNRDYWPQHIADMPAIKAPTNAQHQQQHQENV